MHNPNPQLKAAIEACDRAISQEDYATLMEYYAEDAALVVKPGMVARGKENIRNAFIAIADYFQHPTETGITQVTRCATYVFRQQGERWLCTVDNSYGTDLLDAPEV